MHQEAGWQTMLAGWLEINARNIRDALGWRFHAHWLADWLAGWRAGRQTKCPRLLWVLNGYDWVGWVGLGMIGLIGLWRNSQPPAIATMQYVLEYHTHWGKPTFRRAFASHGRTSIPPKCEAGSRAQVWL